MNPYHRKLEDKKYLRNLKYQWLVRCIPAVRKTVDQIAIIEPVYGSLNQK